MKTNDPLAKLSQTAECWMLDVRPLLLAGREPYSCVMDCIAQLPKGETLEVHALFEPQPLLNQALSMGFKASTHFIGPDHWKLTLTKSL